MERERLRHPKQTHQEKELDYLEQIHQEKALGHLKQSRQERNLGHLKQTHQAKKLHFLMMSYPIPWISLKKSFALISFFWVMHKTCWLLRMARSWMGSSIATLSWSSS